MYSKSVGTSEGITRLPSSHCMLSHTPNGSVSFAFLLGYKFDNAFSKAEWHEMPLARSVIASYKHDEGLKAIDLLTELNLWCDEFLASGRPTIGVTEKFLQFSSFLIRKPQAFYRISLIRLFIVPLLLLWGAVCIRTVRTFLFAE